MEALFSEQVRACRLCEGDGFILGRFLAGVLYGLKIMVTRPCRCPACGGEGYRRRCVE
ncbi:MAG: hypothetical protein KGL35_12120 [Bradyrhizobium sp.]|nr:hypothetical protein [Bradyrhizobium sp.]